MSYMKAARPIGSIYFSEIHSYESTWGPFSFIVDGFYRRHTRVAMAAQDYCSLGSSMLIVVLHPRALHIADTHPQRACPCVHSGCITTLSYI